MGIDHNNITALSFLNFYLSSYATVFTDIGVK